MKAKNTPAQCVICGKGVSEDGNDSVTLSDKGRICKDCAAGIRMVWPIGVDEARENHHTRGMSAYDHTDYISVLVDSLENATADDVRAAVDEAGKIREAYRAKYGDVKGLFLVDTVLRENHLKNKSGLVTYSEELERVFSKLHIIRGCISYGADACTARSIQEIPCSTEKKAEILEIIQGRPYEEIGSFDWWYRADAGFPVSLVFKQKGLKIEPGDIIVKGKIPG